MSKTMEDLNKSGQRIQVLLKCEICDKEYKSKQGLGNHFKNVHNFNLIKEHQCNICQSGFDFQSQLTLHMKIAHGKENHPKCDSCGKKFSRADNLKTHINLVHNGQKDYKCDSCGKSLSTAQYLKIHINSVHNSQKDYKCNSCGKSFSQAANLKRHINIVHTTSVHNGR